MTRAFVRAFEAAGIVATPKHFVANVGDGGRDSYPIAYGERWLEEVAFPPFRAALSEAGARSVMTAYNSVDGSPATQNGRLLRDRLKGAWGFPGFVISDAAATGGATVLHRTEPDTPTAAQHAWEAGLDVVFQSSIEQHGPYLEAVRRGMVSPAVMDSAVARVLRVKFALGLFEQPYPDPDLAAFWNGHPEHRALAREAAGASIVLLRNRQGLLPLNRRLRSLAVIGADAAEARLGGYSAPGAGARAVSILTGLRERLGPTAVRFAPGPGRAGGGPTVVPPSHLAPAAGDPPAAGLTGRYFDNPRLEGEPRIVRVDSQVDFHWTFNPPGRGISRDWYSVRWTGGLTAPPGGVRRLGVEGDDGYRLYLDGRLVIDNWRKQSYGTRLAEVALRAGETHAIRLEYFETAGNGRVRLVWDAGPVDDWRARMDSAVALARRSEVAVIVAGIEEGEFRDRARLGLPGHQEELIGAIAATGTPAVVVLIGGSAITMPWLDRAGAVIQAWYPGEEGGRAVADVLLGDVNPAGRLPLTFPIAEGQLPLVYNHKPTGRGDDYVDLTGQPLFPFGFGLSYTDFAYTGLAIEPAVIGPSDSAVVRCRIRNIGRRAGDEVVQLYLRDLLASVARPVLELKGFQRVRLEPGEERDVAFTLGPEQLRLLDRDRHWVVEPGAFRVLIGASSKDLRLRGELVVR